MPRCRGKTRSGNQCQRTVDPGEQYCYQHESGAATPSSNTRSKRPKGRGKLLAAAAATAATVAAVTIGVDGLKKRRKPTRRNKLFGRKKRS